MIVLLSAPRPMSGCRRRARREGTDGSRCSRPGIGVSNERGSLHPLRMMTLVGTLRMVRRGAHPGAEEAAMGMMFRPRRPLMRVAAGAATATVAYKAGQRRTQQNQYNDQAAPPQAAPAPAAPAPAPTDSTAELERLAKLHESGALNDEEFAAAK